MTARNSSKEHLKRLRLGRALENAAGAWRHEDHSNLAKSGTAQWVLDQRKEDEQRFSKITRK